MIDRQYRQRRSGRHGSWEVGTGLGGETWVVGLQDPCWGKSDSLSPSDKNPLDKRGPNGSGVHCCDKKRKFVKAKD